jgi:3-methylcrotonyl-CoA carboxylase alpha subunit
MPKTIVLRDDSGEYPVVVSDGGTVTVGGAPALAVQPNGDGMVRIGEPAARTAWTAADGDARWVFVGGEVYRFEVVQAGTRRRSGGQAGTLAAPMPATVVRLEVAPGDAVKRGDTLIVLEAMKMELPVRAPADGTVTRVHCRPGELVQPGVPLIDVE